MKTPFRAPRIDRGWRMTLILASVIALLSAALAIEVCRRIGDGVNQAADLISATASIPSLNFIPLTTFGNWF
jgi:hypothetical protein